MRDKVTSQMSPGQHCCCPERNIKFKTKNSDNQQTNNFELIRKAFKIRSRKTRLNSYSEPDLLEFLTLK